MLVRDNKYAARVFGSLTDAEVPVEIVGLNGLLVFAVAGSLLFASHIVAVQRDFIIAMFGDGTKSDAVDGRYNVLLLGADVLGRILGRPGELQVGIVTVVLGGPFFLYFVRRRRVAHA